MEIIDWSLLWSLLAVIVVLYLCYIFSRFLSKKVNTISQTTNIKILEKVMVGQEKSLVIAKICNKTYLLGVSNENIKILKELDENDIISADNTQNMKENFIDIFNMASNKLKSKKNGGKNEKE